MLVICITFYLINLKLCTFKEKETLVNKKVVIDRDILQNVEDVSLEDGKFFISGWAMRLGSYNTNIQLMLQSVDNSQSVLLSTISHQEKNIMDVFSQGKNFGNNSYIAEVNEKKLFENICYEIQLVLDYERESTNDSVEKVKERKKIATGKYLFNGELYSYNPIEFFVPNFTDKEMLQVIKEGVLRGYDIEEKIWIYQYGNDIYLITETTYGSLEANNYKVPIMPFTSQVDLLPEDRIQDGFDHLGAYFEDTVYNREGVLPYQVVKVELSDKYPNTWISTGIYDVTNETWIRHFDISVADWSLEKFK